jgi:hypothetical protein
MGAKEKATANSGKTTEIKNDLVDELNTMRMASTEIISRFQSNLEAEIVWCIDALLQKDPDNRPKILGRKKELKMLLEQLKVLKVKPQKGRLKDIRKIDEIINIIYAKLID